MNDRTVHILRETTRDLAKLNRDLDRGTERRDVTLELAGIEWTLEIEFSADRGERQTWDKPEIPGYLHITAVWSDGYDVLPAWRNKPDILAAIRTELAEER
jgi:hypothetical protein